jgi:hypothetical protein
MAKDDREEFLKFLEDPSRNALYESKEDEDDGIFHFDMTDDEMEEFDREHGIVKAKEVHEEIIRDICGNNKKLIKEIMDKLCQ